MKVLGDCEGCTIQLDVTESNALLHCLVRTNARGKELNVSMEFEDKLTEALTLSISTNNEKEIKEAILKEVNKKATDES